MLEAIRAAARRGGRWEAIDLGGGRVARLWVVDLDGGLQACLTTRFSGVPIEPSAAFLEEARVRRLPPFEADDTVVDLYFESVGKVLSVGTRGGVDRVIGMTAGPWEAAFGLPDRPWPPSVRRRLERRASA